MAVEWATVTDRPVVVPLTAWQAQRILARVAADEVRREPGGAFMVLGLPSVLFVPVLEIAVAKSPEVCDIGG